MIKICSGTPRNQWNTWPQKVSTFSTTTVVTEPVSLDPLGSGDAAMGGDIMCAASRAGTRNSPSGDLRSPRFRPVAGSRLTNRLTESM